MAKTTNVHSVHKDKGFALQAPESDENDNGGKNPVHCPDKVKVAHCGWATRGHDYTSERANSSIRLAALILALTLLHLLQWWKTIPKTHQGLLEVYYYTCTVGAGFLPNRFLKHLCGHRTQIIARKQLFTDLVPGVVFRSWILYFEGKIPLLGNEFRHITHDTIVKTFQNTFFCPIMIVRMVLCLFGQ